MLDRAVFLADADRHATSMRHIRAEAERDLARRRRLMERVRSAVTERPVVDLMADCVPKHVVLHPHVNLLD